MKALVEYYVDNRHPEASDCNAGTQDAPFRTIQAAVDAASDGDTVWVKPGVYRETVKVTKSGFSKERPFRIAATEQRKAIIRGMMWLAIGSLLAQVCSAPYGHIKPDQERKRCLGSGAIQTKCSLTASF